MTNNLEVVKFLLENNIDTSLRSNSGSNALDCAVRNNFTHIENVLRMHMKN